MSGASRRIEVLRDHVAPANDEVSARKTLCRDTPRRSNVTCPPRDLDLTRRPDTSKPDQASHGIVLNPTMAVAAATYAVPLPERLSDGDFQVYR